MLLEDGFVTQQKSTTGVIPDYLHKHVLRKMYTPFTGTSLVSGASEGNAMEASWRVYLPDYVNKANASLVFFLNFNEENNKEVIQCLELKL
jgi:hypothetical protein